MSTDWLIALCVIPAAVGVFALLAWAGSTRVPELPCGGECCDAQD